MRRVLGDSLILLGAYLIAFLLRFDFHTPTWGWGKVFIGFGSAFVLGWAGLLIFRCHRLRARAVSLRTLPRFLYAVGFTVGCQLLLRALFVHESYAIYVRPPIGVIVMAGVLELMGLLLLRYVQRLQLRPIEVADLLGRVETEVGVPKVLESLHNKVVMITGAGGSIGAELARQVLLARPTKLVLLDVSEAALYRVHSELIAKAGKAELVPVVAHCGDRVRMQALLQAERPDVLLHAAAYKHIPLMESNVLEAVSNNAVASRTLAEVAQACGVGTFVLISTDKAVEPISAMGLSKRLAEIFVGDLVGQGQTRFCAVRFGNVLGSSGSVVQTFREQLAKGGPLTVTDARMERTFITLPEASGLILQAAIAAQGGELYVLDMGQPMTILSLAETMIRLSGLTPHKDVPIVFTGMRPGEKLVEAPGLAATHATPTDHPRIYVGHIAPHTHEATEEALQRCTGWVQTGAAVTVDDLRTLLNEEGMKSNEVL